MFNFEQMLSQDNQLKQIPIDMLIPYHNHKFKLYEGERLDDMVQSIKDNGILTPVIVRSAQDKYEILAGHNRVNAARLAGLTTVPGIVKMNLPDDEAEMYVIETNLMQRGFNDLRITEQAAVVAMRHSQMFTSEKRNAIVNELAELENSPMGNNLPSGNSKLAIVGGEYGLSKNSIARLIRVDKLTDELKPYVDNGTLAIRAAVNLSYLFASEQKTIARLIDVWGIDIKKSETLRELSKEKKLNDNTIKLIMAGDEQKASPVQEKPIKVHIQPDLFRKYFKEDTTTEEIADTIDKALEKYFAEI